MASYFTPFLFVQQTRLVVLQEPVDTVPYATAVASGEIAWVGASNFLKMHSTVFGKKKRIKFALHGIMCWSLLIKMNLSLASHKYTDKPPKDRTTLSQGKYSELSLPIQPETFLNNRS